MAGKKGLKKRVWSDGEKRTICTQTLTPGVSVAQVARRYSMNANLIFKCLKDPRFTPVEAGDVDRQGIAASPVATHRPSSTGRRGSGVPLTGWYNGVICRQCAGGGEPGFLLPWLVAPGRRQHHEFWRLGAQAL